MKEANIAEKNKILEIEIGSYLYGTNTKDSDRDYSGIFMPDIEYVLGFQRCDEVDLSIKDKTAEGKNTKDAVDRKMYEFRKFIRLALNNNPNILEMLFVNKENIIHTSPIGESLLKIKHLFPHKGLKDKFLGYAFSQKHKMIIKKDNYIDLVEGYNYLRNMDEQKFMVEVIYEKKIPSFFKIIKNEQETTKFIQIGDINVLPTNTVKKVLLNLHSRIQKAGNRSEFILKYGYDTKFASHLIRLMFEGVEFLKTGKVEFPLKQRQTILDIKQGKWTVKEVLDFSSDLEETVEREAILSPLPPNPRTKEIQDFTVKTLKEYIYE